MTSPSIPSRKSSVATLKVRPVSARRTAQASLARHMQQRFGNRGVQHLLQAKLSVGSPNDMYEREADAAATRVVAGQQVERISPLRPDSPKPPLWKHSELGVDDHSIQRREAEEDKHTQPIRRDSPGRCLCEACVARDPKTTSAAPLQRQAETNDELELYETNHQNSNADVDIATAESAMSRSGTGSPLNPSLRMQAEESFGSDFSSVRVHTDASADEAARALNARAFAQGSDLYLARGESPTDQWLMSHELTHVVQQSVGSEYRTIQSDNLGSNEKQRGNPRGHIQRQSSGSDLTAEEVRRLRPCPEEYARVYRRGATNRGRHYLPTGVFFWHIVSGYTVRNHHCLNQDGRPVEIPQRAVFNVQISFLPRRFANLSRPTEDLAPRFRGQGTDDTRPISFIQWVAEYEADGPRDVRSRMDLTGRDRDPFYGAQRNRSTNDWEDEPGARQGFGGFENWATTPLDQGPVGSRFSRPGSLGAVINDSPGLFPGQRKRFTTDAVVMDTLETLGRFHWSIGFDGSQTRIFSVHADLKVMSSRPN